MTCYLTKQGKTSWEILKNKTCITTDLTEQSTDQCNKTLWILRLKKWQWKSKLRTKSINRCRNDWMNLQGFKQQVRKSLNMIMGKCFENRLKIDRKLSWLKRWKRKERVECLKWKTNCSMKNSFNNKLRRKSGNNNIVMF